MPRLLVVDDDPAQIKIWRLVLECSGHRIDSADNLDGAIAQLAAVGPDILLMDLRLPDLKNGLALIRKASEQETRIVVLSGWPQDLEALPERKFVHRLLGKPVRPNTLLRHIAELTL
jgi:CheY-like chemotaxis protein